MTAWEILRHPVQYIKIAELDCWQNKIIIMQCICTIYTHVLFALWDKATHWLLNLYFDRADVAEWSRALDIRLSDWCCSVSMVWFKFRWRKAKICQLKNQILTLLGKNFRCIYVNCKTPNVVYLLDCHVYGSQ